MSFNGYPIDSNSNSDVDPPDVDPELNLDNLQVSYADTSQIDAFGRLKVANDVTLFTHSGQYGVSNLVWETSLTGGASSIFLSNESAQSLTLTTASGDKVIQQTHEFFVYEPGKSKQIILTGVMGAAKSNVIQRIGSFTDNCGLFFEQNGINLRVVVRSNTSGSVVDTAINQSDWNVDKFDGTGISTTLIDMSKNNIFCIDLQGSGRIWKN